MNSTYPHLHLLIESVYQDKIIQSYSLYYKKCVEHLNTEFPFVVYDKRTDSYFAACDPVGLKPLYYVLVDNTYYFAKDIETLFQKTKIEKEINLQTMQNIVFHSTIAYDETMYKQIKRIPPGHHLFISSDGKCTIERYWKPEAIEIDYTMSEQEAKEKFLAVFDTAIADCIDDYKTTGFELSGGLDSSSVVSWVKYKNPQQSINAFVMDFEHMNACNESEYSGAMEEAYDLTIHHLATETMDYADKYSLENNYRINPHWPIFITYTMGFSIIEKARELGIKTILTGQGGDHIMAGNLYVIHEYFRTFRWRSLWEEFKALPHPSRYLKRYLLFPLLGAKNIKFLTTLYHKIKKQDTSQPIPKISFQELSEAYQGRSVTFYADLVQVLHSTLSALMQSSYYEVAQRQFGIEFRHPFFDRRLIEFMLSLPPKFKYSKGISKVLLRMSMEGILPELIRTRKDKAEFSEVLRQQIDVIDLDALLGNAHLAKLGLIDQEKLTQLMNEYRSGKMKKIIYFWQMINLEYWYRFNFVSKESVKNGLEK